MGGDKVGSRYQAGALAGNEAGFTATQLAEQRCSPNLLKDTSTQGLLMTIAPNPFSSFIVVVVAYGLLVLLLVTAPQNVLGFWPGLMAGIIGCAAWRTFRTQSPTLVQARRRVRIAWAFLVAGFALAMSPQRDIPTAAPFGVLVALTVTLALDRRWAV